MSRVDEIGFFVLMGVCLAVMLVTLRSAIESSAQARVQDAGAPTGYVPNARSQSAAPREGSIPPRARE